MADSKELVSAHGLVRPGFMAELVPSSQQISLLYHLSYLCLAKFPKCERLIRTRALETQLLYASSEALLLKCMGTSENLVSTLFPRLIRAVETNKPTMATGYLEKARQWITDIIQQVDKIIDRYDEHNKNVNDTTSDIITEKRNTEDKAKQLSTEVKAMEEALEKVKHEMQKISKEVAELEKQIASKTQELEDHIRSVASTNKGLGTFASVVPFIESLIKYLYGALTGTGVAQKTRALENQLNQLNSQKTCLKQQEWTLQLKVIEDGMKLAQKKIDHGAIPDPVHLKEVQQCLTKIQKILIQLKSFWEKVLSMLGTMQGKTFVDENLVHQPEDKEMFVTSIQEASKVWKHFGLFCNKATEIFREQNKNAYNFLEIDPSSLSPEVWQQEYNSVTEQLKTVHMSESCAVPAISEVPAISKVITICEVPDISE